MKIVSVALVFLSGGIVGWGAHLSSSGLSAGTPKEIVVQHPDPDVNGSSTMTRVNLCRVGDTDLEAIPAHATPNEYWVITINGVHYCGVGRAMPNPWAEARAARRVSEAAEGREARR